MQLLSLIETCVPSKQEKLLDTVAKEDGLWAETIRAKMLNIDRIYSWNDEALMEIFGVLQDLTVAVALKAADETLRARLNGFVSHGRRRKIEDMHGSNNPSPGEIQATHMKIVECVRKMGADGLLRFERFDVALMIDEEIDNRLMHPAGPATTAASPFPTSGDSGSRVLHAYSPLSAHQAAQTQSAQAAAAPIVVSGSASSESPTLEMQALKRRVSDLSRENATLRHELSVAKSKLDQIKKIA